MHLMKRRNLRVQERNRNSKIILILLVLLLVGRNKILQVQASGASDARNLAPRDMKKSAKLRTPSAMDVASFYIIR